MLGGWGVCFWGGGAWGCFGGFDRRGTGRHGCGLRMCWVAGVGMGVHVCLQATMSASCGCVVQIGAAGAERVTSNACCLLLAAVCLLHLLPPVPSACCFCLPLIRSFLGEYALPQRAYIGPTSMDPELAFIMTNMAQVCVCVAGGEGVFCVLGCCDVVVFLGESGGGDGGWEEGSCLGGGKLQAWGECDASQLHHMQQQQPTQMHMCHNLPAHTALGCVVLCCPPPAPLPPFPAPPPTAHTHFRLTLPGPPLAPPTHTCLTLPVYSHR